MCQIVPFTLPCCRRVYVEVSKLPSCPNSWPNRKCPPELCIQVRAYDAEHRDSGTCWRCLADHTGAAGHNREIMRPKIDRASLVLGLEEIGVTGRRRKTERDGECWFCAAKGGCKSCGSKDIVEGEGDEKPDITGFKRIRELGSLKGKEVARKRPKIERQDSYAQIPTRISHYPDPNVSTQWQQPYPHTQLYNPDPQGRGHTPKVFNQEHESYSQDFGAEEASYDGLPSSETHEGFGTNWQAINSPQSNVPGASNAATEQYRSSKVSSNEAPFQQFHPVPHAASSKQIELQRGQISRTSNQSRQYKVGAPEIKLQEYPSPAQQTPEPYLQHAPRLINYENTGFSQTRLNDSRISNPGLNYPDLYGEYPAIQPDEASKYSNSNNIVQHQTGSDEYQGFMPLQHNSHNYILPASKIDPALQDTLIEQSAEGKSSGGKQQSNHADEDVFNSHYYSNDYTPYLDPNIQQSHQDMSSFLNFDEDGGTTAQMYEYALPAQSQQSPTVEGRQAATRQSPLPAVHQPQQEQQPS